MEQIELIGYVERAAARDAEAVEALYRYTYPGMYSLVYRLCDNKNDVEDILQESYITAFSKLDMLVEKAAFVGWLKKIVVNTWRDYLRNKTVTHETSVSDVTDDQWEDWQHTESAQDTVEISETNREIRELVEALPQHQRICVILYYYEEMPVEDIATALGIPAGTVMSRLHYGRQKLKEDMTKRGIHSYGVLAAPATQANPALLAKILAALEMTSDGTTAAIATKAVGGGIAAKIGLAAVSLVTAGGIIGGAAMLPRRERQEQQPVTTATRMTTTAAATTTTATTTTTTTTTTTAPPTTTTTTAATTTTATTTAPPQVMSFDYQAADGGVCLTRYTGNVADVTIPDTLDGLPVVAIGNGAFQYNDIIESVSIPASVRTIHDNAFRECHRLRRISLGSGVNDIGGMAFLGCDALERVTIPANVRRVDIYAFAYCEGLSEVVIEEGVTSLGAYAFAYCPGLQTVTLPDSVTQIGKDALP